MLDFAVPDLHSSVALSVHFLRHIPSPPCVTVKRLYSFGDAEQSEILRSHMFLLSLFWGVFQLHTSRLLLQVWKLHQKANGGVLRT